MQAGLSLNFVPLTLSHLLWEPKMNYWSFLFISWRWDLSSLVAHVQELPHPWSVRLWPRQNLAYEWLNCDLLPDSPDLVTFGGWREGTGQLSEPLCKEEHPGGKVPCRETSNEPFALFPSCTLVETRMAHTCSLLWEERRQVCLFTSLLNYFLLLKWHFQALLL